MRLRLIEVIGLFVAGVVVAQPALCDTPAPGMERDAQHDIQYGPTAAQSLDLCLPANADHAPAAILIHGGGWRIGDKKSFQGLCRQAAARGVVAASINYRLASATGNHWPDQIVDVQLAIRWLRSNAARLHIDENHICAVGSSAGAQLAVLAGTTTKIFPGDLADNLSGVSPALDCVVSISGPVDLSDPHYRTPDLPLFGTATRAPEAERAASPLFQITSQMPPVLVIQGEADPLVPPNQAKELVDALRHNGVPVQAIFHHGGHALSHLELDEKRAIGDATIVFIKSPKQPLPNFGYVWQN